MPRIPVIQPRENLPARSPSPSIAGAPGAAIEGLGRSVTRVGAQAADVAATANEKRQREAEALLKKQRDADNASYFAKVSADAELSLNEWILERRKQATSKEEDFNLDGINGHISDYYSGLVKDARKAKFEDAANALLRDGERVRINIMKSSMKFKATLNVSNRVSDLTDSANSIVNLARIGGDFNKAKEKMVALFTAAEQVLDPTHPFLDSADNYLSAVAGAHIENLYESDSDGTLKRLKAGEFNDDLLPGELDRLIKKGEGLKNDRIRDANAARKVSIKKLDALVDDIEKVQENGYEWNAGGLSVIDVAKLAQDMGGEEGKAFLKRIKESTRDAFYIREFSRQPLSEQEKILAGLHKERKQSARSVGRIKRAEKAYKNAVSEFEAGRGLDHAARLGVIEPVPPLDFTNGETLSQSIRARVKASDTVEAYFGKTVTPLNDSEVDSFALILEKGTPEQDMSLLAALVNGAGSHAVPVMELLSKKDSGIYAAAGGLVIDGAPNAALSVLRGLEQVKANRSILPKQVDFDTEYNSVVGMTYSSLPKQGALIKEAVKMVYADKAARAGVPDGKMDDEILKKAIVDVTGGIIEFKDNLIEAPERGMDENEFENWIESLTQSDIGKMGGVLGFEPDKALEIIKDKSILTSEGEGRYKVLHKEGVGGERELLNKKGETFLLEYGLPANPSRPPALSEKEAAKLRAKEKTTRALELGAL